MPGRPTVAKTKETSGQVMHRMKQGGSTDLLVVIAIVLVAAIAALALPEGSVARLILTLPVIFFAPGYLLIQAVVGGSPPVPARMRHGLVSVGVSPALVGLLALATSLVPGGFRPTTIVVTVVAVSLLIGLVALYRRTPSEHAVARPTARPVRA